MSSWLLKIVEGPAAGAEVALVHGTRVTVGPTDDCDIVLPDAALPTFSLDVAGTGVTLVTAAGEARALRPFEIEAFGTTAFAFGPGEGPWQPLVRRSDPAPSAAPEETPSPAPATSPASPHGADAPDAHPAAPDDAPAAPDDAPAAPARNRRAWGCGCLAAALVILVLLLVAGWFFRAPLANRFPAVAAQVEKASAAVRGWCGAKKSAQADAPNAAPTLAVLVEQYGLERAEKDGRPLLKGNVKRRTERLAIRSVALAEDPRTAFDLTDDETLKASADELLFVVTEGALKATAASNRVVSLAGYAPSTDQLARAVRALNQDVPGIDRLDTAAVQVGGMPAAAVAQTKFAAAAPKPPVAATAGAVARRDYPIAGIVTKPFPLVVMRNGLRLAEGAQIGTAVIERIEADRLVLRDGKSTFEWEP